MGYERNIETARTRGQVNRERERARRAFQAKRIDRQEFDRVQRAASRWREPRQPTRSFWEF